MKPIAKIEKLTALILTLAVAGWLAVHSAPALELTDLSGPAHGYPAFRDLNGKTLADGEFLQWLEDQRLHIRITYRFKDGRRIEENGVLRQEPEIAQDAWSWRESKDGETLREFKVNFGAKTATAQAREQGELKQWEETIEVEPGKTFAGFGFSWVDYKKITTETEHFDLHHFVKAYAARHGQSTQFIRQKTTITVQPCRVRWWLSLALYAKALRTPWRLDCLDDETAFVGIGYSLDQDAALGSHVLLGCSHLYNARGEGLQFRLGRIENPIIRGRNPFMSVDDARRTGETIRQLFFDAKMRLPSRVVVHKRTPFTYDEQRGLLQGLDGVQNVELIEVTIEESLRYLASSMINGKLEIDKFPIPRGAVVILNRTAALLWVHGVTPNAMNPNWKYYQGKRRIPTPLLIRRYRGQSDVVQVATEILGLSKMNWNTFDYYSRLPATLDSASAIAKVGAYLSGFSSAPYDYRLLI